MISGWSLWHLGVIVDICAVHFCVCVLCEGCTTCTRWRRATRCARWASTRRCAGRRAASAASATTRSTAAAARRRTTSPPPHPASPLGTHRRHGELMINLLLPIVISLIMFSLQIETPLKLAKIKSREDNPNFTDKTYSELSREGTCFALWVVLITDREPPNCILKSRYTTS